MNALNPAHRQVLEVDSAITPEVIVARGYRTVTDPNELYQLGYSPKQCNVPGLLIPIHTPDGGNGLYRYRPDHPRLFQRNKEWHELKYEQPKGKGLRLDVNPLAAPDLANPTKPLAFVEGEKKADCLLSHGLAAVALPGVFGFKGRNKFGGVVLSTDLDSMACNGRTVYIIFDSDAAQNINVSKAEARLAEVLKRRGAAVHIIRIPPGANGKKTGADDYLSAGHTLAELLALEVNAPQVLDSSYANVKADGLPGVKITGRHLRDVANDAYLALLTANAIPYFYVRGGEVVRVKVDEQNRPDVEGVNESIMRGRLARCANFYTERESSGVVMATPQPPPLDVVKDLLASSRWDFPTLTGIIECPALRPNGTVIDRQGYDSATGLLYLPADGLQVDPIPEQPTGANVARALSILREAIGDFPYADDASAANALAALLTPILRPAINGRVPLALFDAPQAGTGKSLLASVIGLLTTGHDPAIITAPKDGDEWRKKITSVLMTGAAVITIDNLAGTLFAGELAAALTTGVWCDRVLGSNDTTSLPQRATWLATGNNIRLGGDLPRRCYQIRLDAKSSRPWKRTGFQHYDLLGWVGQNRGKLIAAALTLARAWWAAGCPDGHAPTIGGFSEWTRMLGGVLAHAGVKEFLGNLEDMYQNADDDGPQWEAFLLKLHEINGINPVTVTEVCEQMLTAPGLLEMVPDMFDSPVDDKGNVKVGFKKKLGRAFLARNETRFGDSEAKVEKRADDTHAKISRWRFSCGVCGICGVSFPQPQTKIEEINILQNAHMGTPGGETNPAYPANPAEPERECPSCHTSNWRRRPDNSEFCGTCHP